MIPGIGPASISARSQPSKSPPFLSSPAHERVGSSPPRASASPKTDVHYSGEGVMMNTMMPPRADSPGLLLRKRRHAELLANTSSSSRTTISGAQGVVGSVSDAVREDLVTSPAPRIHPKMLAYKSTSYVSESGGSRGQIGTAVAGGGTSPSASKPFERVTSAPREDDASGAGASVPVSELHEVNEDADISRSRSPKRRKTSTSTLTAQTSGHSHSNYSAGSPGPRPGLLLLPFPSHSVNANTTTNGDGGIYHDHANGIGTRTESRPGTIIKPLAPGGWLFLSVVLAFLPVPPPEQWRRRATFSRLVPSCRPVECSSSFYFIPFNLFECMHAI